MIRIAANPSPFEQAETHLVEIMFYDQWAPSGESSVSEPRGTFVPKWEDIQGDSEPDLRELLARKRKRKEASAAESDDMPQCVMAGLCTNYKSTWGPQVRCKRAPSKNGNTGVWRVVQLKKV